MRISPVRPLIFSIRALVKLNMSNNKMAFEEAGKALGTAGSLGSAKRPGAAMKRILTWLKLPPARIDVSDVSASTNQKYEQEYCSRHLNDLSMARAHCVASGVLQPLIAPMGLDYDVRDGGPSGFGCIASRLKALAPPSSSMPYGPQTK